MATDDSDAPRKRRATASSSRITAEEWVAKHLAEAPPLTDERWEEIEAILNARPVRSDRDRNAHRGGPRISR